MNRTAPGAVAVLSLAALVACGGGGSGSNPTPVSTPTPTPTPAATPTLPTGLVCDPTPPPLYGINVKVHFDSGGQRKTLDSRPVVINMGDFCDKAGFAASAKFCFTRQEGDPQATACDYLAVGRSGETGRWGPTWSYNGKPCTAGPGENGCSNHPDNQFLVNTRGDGTYEACAAPEIPLSQDPDKPGSRCGSCRISGGGTCQ
jgi:hypothetical protein